MMKLDNELPICSRTSLTWPRNVLLGKVLLGIVILGVTIWALTVVLANGLPRSHGHISSLFPPDSATLRAFQKDEQTFGGSLLDVISVVARPELDDELEERYYSLEEEIAGISGVVRVLSPQLGYSRLAPPVGLLSPARDRGRFLVSIDSGLSDEELEKINGRLDGVLQRYADLEPFRAGSFFTSMSVTNAIREETTKRIPECIAVLLLTSMIVFRSVVIGVIALFAPLLTLLWTMAGLVKCSTALGPVSQLSPPVILTVTCAYSVHAVARVLESKRRNRNGDVLGTHWDNRLFGEVILGTIYSVFTTVMGIGSLVMLRTQGVSDFALLSAFGIVLGGVLSLLVPYILSGVLLGYTPRSIFKKAENNAEKTTKDSAEEIAPTGLFHPRAVYSAVAFGVSVVLLFGVAKITINNTPLTFLPSGSPALESIANVKKYFPGNHLLVVLFESEQSSGDVGDVSGIKGQAPVPTTLPENLLGEFTSLKTKLQQVTGVYTVVTPSSFAAPAAIGGNVSEEEEIIDRWGPSYITNEEKTAARVLIETDREGKELLILADSVRQSLAGIELKYGVRVSLESIELIMAEQTTYLARGIINSLTTTLLLVVILLLVQFRSLKLMVVGLLPNLLPIIAVFGVIGYTYGEMNLGASLVASAALAIIVDNTFHLMINWQHHRSGGGTAPAISALREVERSFLLSAVILVAGFGVLVLSSVLPVSQFGFLLLISIVLGLFAATLVLPFLLSRVR